jgi:ribosomal protein S5
MEKVFINKFICKGKGMDFEESLGNAIMHCKKNLIAIPLDIMHNLPRKISTHFYGISMDIVPRESFNSWGNPFMAHMLLLAGINQCRFKIVHRNLNMYALVNCFFKAVTMNKTPRMIAEEEGVKVYRTNWGRPYAMGGITALASSI